MHFRVWAPRSNAVAVELTSGGVGPRGTFPLQAEDNGYFSGLVNEASAGARYKFRLDQGSFPDPASRFQPDGPHGASQVVDPKTFAWTDQAWRGRPVRELVIYEMHIGTFTAAGTWHAAMEKLPGLVDLGITMLEVMPVADFPGRFGWGYDGVCLFAPTRIYGSPDDFRAFVNRAHQLGLCVILDVVYNHVGPDGNYLREFSPDYFSRRYGNEWGEALNFDDVNSGPVREFFISNARYWIDEYHLDGLRLDATQQIFDASPTHVLAEITAATRAAAPERQIFVVGENETQNPQLVRSPAVGGYGLDALWNDDFHHVARVAATGRTEAYYAGYRGTAQEFVSALKHGFLFQGQYFRWQKIRRGRNGFDLRPRQFVHFVQNHDQVANSWAGHRLHQMTNPGRLRTLTALTLLGPQIPMLFQGQEFGASAPFLFFADHQPELAQKVLIGRREFISQFRTVASLPPHLGIPDPASVETFQRCKLSAEEATTTNPVWKLHADLLRLRRSDPTISSDPRIEVATLAKHAFVMRFFGGAGGLDRILVVNLDTDLWLEPVPEPLLAPMDGHGWRILWSSEAPEYGSGGTAPLETTSGWFIPADAAVLLEPDENSEPPNAKLSQKD